MKIIDGRIIAERIEAKLTEELAAQKLPLSVASLFVGEATDSALYTKRKAEAAARLGITFIVERLASTAGLADIESTIDRLNTRADVDGYIIQLPLPEPLRPQTDRLLNLMDPARDVDGLTTANREQLLAHTPKAFLPTPIGAVLMALASCFPETRYEEQLQFLTGRLPQLVPASLQGKTAVIVSDGDIFAQTLQAVLSESGVNTMIVRSDDPELSVTLNRAKLVITAVGKPHLITSAMIADNAIVIDVGTTLVNGKTLGDINPHGLATRNIMLTPVPGGIGPITVAMLFANALTLKLQALS